MVQRCTNPNNAAYESYGGRGIAVCDEWRDFAAFFRDMGHRPPGMSLDRIDVNDGYHPGNCRWATKKQQQNNRRDTPPICLCGEVRSAAEWAQHIGIDTKSFLARLRRGWSEDEIVNTPPDRANSVTRANVKRSRDINGKFTTGSNHA
jgi:hypothetical protein